MARTRRPTCASRMSATKERPRSSTSRSAGAAPARSIGLNELRLPMPGRHNVSNADGGHRRGPAARHFAGGHRKGLAGFAGVKRRFTHTGEWNGVQVFDDYGHHPVEIKAVLKAARDSCKGRIIAIHQPHRYSRVASLFEEFACCFNDADTVFIAPIYSAGEDPIEGVTAEELVSRIKSGGHRDARFLATPDALARPIRAIAATWGLCGSVGGRKHNELGGRRCRRNWQALSGKTA